ncbi:helix-turn-helix domain-containing protein [Acinetobacter sp.]|jgi:transcriptional regulator GlxA family with amidase domain|uniref:GlxA family transcriptional regulator n=1 Tax=Acinetobacter sp. TaxID=472 RepID=UPI0028192C6A|nr:helix-turn-helix domain-containing protein [Acinetobacter sp.]MDR0235804.1 helix-turn-helix domain-containing protein [Acinetobacter sp.]
MIKITVVGFDGVLASALTCVVDLFSMTGASWNRLQNQDIQRLFQVQIASLDGKSIQCINGIQIQADVAFEDIQTTDVIVVPTIGASIEQIIMQHREVIEFLKYADQQQWTIVGMCTGNFFLAEAGVLNQRVATTHWGFKALFEQRYPKVDLKTDQLITRSEHIYCAGGGLAWFDTGLHLIERFYGFDIAIQTAKSFVIDYRRGSQLSYSIMRISSIHHDELIERIQQWIEIHFSEPISIEGLAQQFNVTLRTLIRRFKAALGLPPIHYIQTIRIEAAQKRLEETEQSIDLIMQSVGYLDPSSFRRLFRKKTGLTPLEYRRRFSRN